MALAQATKANSTLQGSLRTYVEPNAKAVTCWNENILVSAFGKSTEANCANGKVQPLNCGSKVRKHGFIAKLCRNVLQADSSRISFPKRICLRTCFNLRTNFNNFRVISFSLKVALSFPDITSYPEGHLMLDQNLFPYDRSFFTILRNHPITMFIPPSIWYQMETST